MLEIVEAEVSAEYCSVALGPTPPGPAPEKVMAPADVAAPPPPFPLPLEIFESVAHDVPS